MEWGTDYRVKLICKTSDVMGVLVCLSGIISTTIQGFDCCSAVHVDKYSIKVSTTCTSFIIEAQKLQFCTYVFTPTCFDPRGSSSGGTMPVPG
jgi:hypothetical protein